MSQTETLDMDVDQESELLQEIWPSDINKPLPFKLASKSTSPNSTAGFRAIACFPWDLQSLETLWGGGLSQQPELQESWEAICRKWMGVVVAGGGRKLRFFVNRPQAGDNEVYQPLFTISVPDEKAEVRCISWCMVQNANHEFRPLVAFSGNSVLYIFNVEEGCFHGTLIGHGGQINCIATHPAEPDTILTTSHDYTVRIYDLTISAQVNLDNPCWPGMNQQALGGPAFGQRSWDGEGDGYGRCIAVLAGGPSGGHRAAVLCAAFHPNPRYQLIATAGMDHAVKIWRRPDPMGEKINREDKPLFSSTRVHSAQVLSISWLGQDILLSHSGPIILRADDESDTQDSDTMKLIKEPGTLVLWQWLGFERFCPPHIDTFGPNLRGCASDYEESSSFKVLSEYKLPLPIAPTYLQVYKNPTVAPILLLAGSDGVQVVSLKEFKPRKPRPYPNSVSELTDLAASLKLEKGREEQTLRWKLLRTEEKEPTKVLACAFNECGTSMIGVGERETVWVWRFAI